MENTLNTLHITNKCTHISTDIYFISLVDSRILDDPTTPSLLFSRPDMDKLAKTGQLVGVKSRRQARVDPSLLHLISNYMTKELILLQDSADSQRLSTRLLGTTVARRSTQVAVF